jgi:transposase
MARPSKLNAERIATIGAVLAGANSLKTSAKAAGISESTLSAWCAKGRQERARLEANPKARMKASEKLFVELSETVDKSVAQADVTLVGIVRNAAVDDWKAASWLLERRDPKTWGRQTREPRADSSTTSGAIERAIGGLTSGPLLPGE